jgi:hypothetical protein
MKFLVTGTQVYGPVREDSDLDIVVLKKDHTGILNWLAVQKIATYQTEKQEAYANANAGFYFNLFGITVNIIIVDGEAELRSWKHSTEKLKKLPPIEDRDNRIFSFWDNE